MHVENALKMILTTIVKGLEIMKFTKKWLAPGLDQRFLSKLIHPIIWHIAVYVGLENA